MIVRAEEYRRQLEDTVNDDPDIEALRLTPSDWRQLSDIKKILAPFDEYTEYVSRDNPSIHMAARMFGELRSILLAIKERRGEWQKVSPTITVPVSDGISLLEKYHNCVPDSGIYYIASILDHQTKTKWLKTLPHGEEFIDRIWAFLGKAYSTPKQPILTTPNTNWKTFEYRSLEAFQPTQVT
mgnify:FL=1